MTDEKFLVNGCLRPSWKSSNTSVQQVMSLRKSKGIGVIAGHYTVMT